jgi:siroheme decarboxylase
MDAIDRLIVNLMQNGFPITELPYRRAAELIGISEDELIERLGRMLDDGVLTRFGPLFQIERVGGAFTLAAMSVPKEDFERVAAIVNAMPEVAHNYERGHELNMWFVVAAETPEGIGEAIARIERDTGCKVIDMPKFREYFIGLKFDV